MPTRTTGVPRRTRRPRMRMGVIGSAAVVIAVGLTSSAGGAATVTESRVGTITAGAASTLAVTTGGGVLTVNLRCDASKAKVLITATGPGGSALAGSKKVKCGRPAATGAFNGSSPGEHRILLQLTKGATTPFSALLTFETNDGTATLTTTINTVPTSGVVTDASCTGAADHTAYLQGQINKAGNGGELQISGRCRLSGELRIVGRENLTVRGPATLDGSTNVSSARHLRIQGGHGITVRDLTIVGARGDCATDCNSDPFFRQHGIAVESTSGDPITDVLIDRVEISGVNGDFVYLGAKDNPKIDLPIGLSPAAAAAVLLTDADLPKRVTITNNRFANSGRQGISVSGGDQVLISGNRVEAAGRTTFDFEAEAGGALLVEISNNQILRYDNAVVNIGCADRGGLGLLNRGPIKVLNNITYGQDLKINTSCDEADAILDIQGNTRVG